MWKVVSNSEILALQYLWSKSGTVIAHENGGRVEQGVGEVEGAWVGQLTFKQKFTLYSYKSGTGLTRGRKI